MDANLCDPDNISNWFWGIIQRAEKDRAKLETILQALSIDEILRFALEFHDASSALWSTAYANHLIYRSEDDIEDISHWVVSQGKELYAAVCAQPDIIAKCEEAARTDSRTLAFVADGILTNQLGDDWDLYDDYQDFADSGYSTVSDYWKARKEHKQ